MDMSAVQSIVSGLLSFRSVIVFTTREDPHEIVKAAIDYDLRIPYFLESFSWSGRANRYELKPKYVHLDTKITDVHVVRYREACVRLMCRYVGDYKKKLVVAAPKTVNLDLARQEYLSKYGAFYPNLTNVHTTIYGFDGGHPVHEYEFAYRVSAANLQSMERSVDAEVERLAKLMFLPNMPVEAKIYLAHNYLATNVVYRKKDSTALASSFTQSAYGALIKHECVCQGYAEAFKRLMDYAGIDCDVVSGTIAEDGERHAWNIISLGAGRGYYHVDVTWDSEGTKPRYEHFCNTDQFYSGKRIWNKSLYQICAGKENVLNAAKTYIRRYRSQLLARGISPNVLDC